MPNSPHSTKAIPPVSSNVYAPLPSEHLNNRHIGFFHTVGTPSVQSGIQNHMLGFKCPAHRDLKWAKRPDMQPLVKILFVLIILIFSFVYIIEKICETPGICQLPNPCTKLKGSNKRILFFIIPTTKSIFKKSCILDIIISMSLQDTILSSRCAETSNR